MKPLNFLNELGTTSDQVAESLKQLGIKGKRDDMCNCPLARYLQAKGIPDAEVDGAFYIWIENDGYREEFLPEACSKFVHSFDRKEYPELEE